MEQYIRKFAIIAEIEKLKESKKSDWHFDEFDEGYKSALEDIFSFLDTLEMKEVDLDFQKFAKEMEIVFALPSSKTKNTEEAPLNWEYVIAKHFFELGLNSQTKDMKEALCMEYEKGKADAIAEMQKEQTKEYLEGFKRVQNYKELTKFEKGFDRIADAYAHRKNKDGYNKPWYTKERAAEMLYWAKEELGILNEQ